MFSNWMLQSKEFNPENFNTLAIILKGHASKLEIEGENDEELSAIKVHGEICINCLII